MFIENMLSDGNNPISNLLSLFSLKGIIKMSIDI